MAKTEFTCSPGLGQEPRTQSPELRTQNSEPRTQNPSAGFSRGNGDWGLEIGDRGCWEVKSVGQLGT